MNSLWLIVWYASLCCLLREAEALQYRITPSQSLSDGESLVSEEGSFELGFFSPGSSKYRYLGIWYRNIAVRTVVWVANRKIPIKDLSGVLTVNSTGSLVLLSGKSNDIWSTNSFREARSPVAKLLDSGNLVLVDEKDGNSDVFLWQSFDYPSDTLLPGMKYGWDLRAGLNRRITSWKNSDDPSPGALSAGLDLHRYPESVIWKNSRKYYRGGPWNGLRFSGGPELRPNPVFDFKFVSNQDEAYYMYQLKNKSVITRLVLNDTTSTRQRYVWVEADQSWKLYGEVPRDYCDNFNLCGANGVCVISDSPVCQCLEGFKPKSPESWNSMDWSQGCILSEPLNCLNRKVFVKFTGLKLPDTTSSWVNATMNLAECRETCLKNCSCMAYTNLDVRGQGSGCALWFGNLIDIRQFPDSGQDLYIRIEASDKGFPAVKVIIIVVITAAVFSGMLLACYCLFRRKKGKAGEESQNNPQELRPTEDPDLPFFDLATISLATDDFSLNNKLGEGGFGPVYKGTLTDGRDIAVKRLSQSSGQGMNEFKNEVRLIAKLQHRNLVRLIGSCIDGEEKMLIYEYMANKSLNSFLFDKRRKRDLNWSRRFQIICGIARGLLYLHQDSRLRIIHRDLKASNVLLDEELNPKISDFGMARTFGGDQNEDNTRRVVGTYGYMAPEYALYGLFSVKSDVFSFGILLLEIISGKKNGSFNHSEFHHNLIGYAWQVWTEGRPLELIDSSLDDSCSLPEMLRCMHVALLCIQQSPDNRPNMSSVVLMLNGESTLPEPKQPGFLIDVMPTEAYPSSSQRETCSVNEITFTLLDAR
ncbi:G-type lectin S-receptor-like serine/threonine-protein kinase At4g27290 isoform X1 [Ipomoea triloba]|uniref:G-type lectin S-receptor-like serine/threonine-protein kinase At4g27290 isoform X1 n=1 Tax=Ipomoea triloba TaxID=35885 RepID=UPI00125CFF36|nr:G-type lectin S-receptor-like serine/threonine-protein kinase At4g27290 isoform X1 [Ipomoea triloba]